MDNHSPIGNKFESELFRHTPIILEVYDFFVLFHHALTKFPKSEKHSLGIEIEKSIIQILKRLITCSSSDLLIKQNKLPEISSDLDILKILVRLSSDIKAIDLKVYLTLQEKLQVIGRMLGGWIRSLK